MKTLHLLRHAKSSWDEPGLSDRERGLNPRGLRDAPMMGTALAEILEPMAVFVSPARRACMTLDGLCQGWPDLRRREHYTIDRLYTFSSEELLLWLADCDDLLDSVFAIGHNPAFTDLVNTLVGEPCLDNLPTAGYVQLSLSIDSWADLPRVCGTVERQIFPRQLRNGHPRSTGLSQPGA